MRRGGSFLVHLDKLMNLPAENPTWLNVAWHWRDWLASGMVVTNTPRVLDAARIPWARRAVWAPSIVEKDGWYYLFFGANDIQSDKEVGGIGIARARRPDARRRRRSGPGTRSPPAA